MRVFACPGVSQAAGPDRILRTFGFWVHDETPDFQGDDSRALVVLPEATERATGSRFYLLMDGDHTALPTGWLFGPAHHVVQGGQAPVGDYFWLFDVDNETPTPPPPGALTFTGPDGLIESVEVVRIKPCGSDCGYGNEYLWETDDVNGTTTFVIVSAWFSK